MPESDGPSKLAIQIASDVHGEDVAKTLWRRAREHETKYTRLTPRRLSFADYLTPFLARSPGRVRKVPISAISEDGTDSEGDFAFVACPCGAHPVVRSQIAKCDGCERWYIVPELGAVFVIYGDMEPPPPPS